MKNVVLQRHLTLLDFRSINLSFERYISLQSDQGISLCRSPDWHFYPPIHPLHTSYDRQYVLNWTKGFCCPAFACVLVIYHLFIPPSEKERAGYKVRASMSVSTKKWDIKWEWACERLKKSGIKSESKCKSAPTQPAQVRQSTCSV